MDHDKKKSGFPNLLGRSRPSAEKGSSFPSDFVVKSKAETVPAKAALPDKPTNSVTPAPEPIPKSTPLEKTESKATNYISADLSDKDRREIYDAIDLIRQKLSFAKDFTEDERSNLMRLGKTGRNFVEKAQHLVSNQPGILPRSFDLDEFKRDAELYQELGNIADELQRLTERVADTEAAVGSDAFTAALVVYQSGKMARCGDDMDNHLIGWRRKISDSIFD